MMNKQQLPRQQLQQAFPAHPLPLTSELASVGGDDVTGFPHFDDDRAAKATKAPAIAGRTAPPHSLARFPCPLNDARMKMIVITVRAVALGHPSSMPSSMSLSLSSLLVTDHKAKAKTIASASTTTTHTGYQLQRSLLCRFPVSQPLSLSRNPSQSFFFAAFLLSPAALLLPASCFLPAAEEAEDPVLPLSSSSGSESPSYSCREASRALSVRIL